MKRHLRPITLSKAALIGGGILAILGLALLPATKSQAQAGKPYEWRWFYAQYNLQVEKSADEVIALIDRAAKSGYNGMVLADYKFNILERLPAHYFKHFAKVKKAAEAANIEIIPTVCSIGYSSGILAHDANLAEGMPVKDAPAVVKGGQAVLVADPAAKIVNGDFENVKGNKFTGFSFQDAIGQASFADSLVKHDGKYSLRIQDATNAQPAGNCRISQRVKVRPWACYRLSCWLKTQDLKPVGAFRLLALGTSKKGPNVLTHFDGDVQVTQDWKKVEVVFNSLHNDEVNVYAGVWSGPKGTLWLDDFQIEELFLANVLRRPGCPLTVTSQDGKTPYEEGKDFEPVQDPKLGNDPWAGEYKYNHPGPALKLTKNSRLKEGDKLRVSWYHPVLTHSYQVMCCLSEPKVYAIVRDQIKRVNDLVQPKTFFMSHDEIRVANWCEACQKQGKTPGQLLADNARRCIDIIQEVNPKAKIVVWSDMFDPFHNAVDNYYLVNGPFTGSWEGLPKNVVIANWNGGKAEKSLKWFADRGHAQIIAGFYDGDLSNFKKWDAAAKNVEGARGFMYTTWQHNYKYLEAYGTAMQGK